MSSQDNPFPKFALCLKLDNTMFSDDQYQLLDFGDGRKLERLGAYVVDRPCRAAEGVRRKQPRQWGKAAARFEIDRSNQGHWVCPQPLSPEWMLHHGSLTFQLKLTPFGHVGIFVEQARNWDWVIRCVRRAKQPLNVLNLFAYTGGTTLAAASAGAQVCHVDASKSAVAQAKENARHSGLGDAPIRWIVDDVSAFVRREVRRKNQYDAIILDPPSYGHGPKNEVWKLTDHLPKLLQGCRQLLSSHRAFVLLTCHTPGYGPAELQATVTDTFFGSCQVPVVARHLSISCIDGRRLLRGAATWWPS